MSLVLQEYKMIQTQYFHVRNSKHTLELCPMHLIHAKALLSRVSNRLSNINICDASCVCCLLQIKRIFD